MRSSYAGAVRCTVEKHQRSAVLLITGHALPTGDTLLLSSMQILRKNKATPPDDVFNQMKADEAGAGLPPRKAMLPPAEVLYMAEDGYMGAHFDHFVNFFNGVREGTPVAEDAVFGLRAAAPALACNDSYFGDRIIRWDPEAMEVLP